MNEPTLLQAVIFLAGSLAALVTAILRIVHTGSWMPRTQVDREIAIYKDVIARQDNIIKSSGGGFDQLLEMLEERLRRIPNGAQHD